MPRSPDANEFEQPYKFGWLCRNCGRVPTDPQFCDYCEFPRLNKPDVFKPKNGAVTRADPPTADPEGNDAVHGGLL